MNETWWRALLKLYPVAWRRRYEEEFLATFGALPLSWRRSLDLIAGALDAHLRQEFGPALGDYHMIRRLRLIAAAGALLSLLLIGLSLTSAVLAEEDMEFLVLLAPAALLPAVVALHRIYRPHAPGLSRLTAAIGVAGTAGFVLVTLVGLSPWATAVGALLELVAPLAAGVVGLPGLWLALAAFLGWRLGILPSLLALSGFVSGVTWIILMASASIPATMLGSLRSFLSLNILFWLLSHSVWSVWLGLWLMRWSAPEGSGPNELETVPTH